MFHERFVPGSLLTGDGSCHVQHDSRCHVVAHLFTSEAGNNVHVVFRHFTGSGRLCKAVASKHSSLADDGASFCFCCVAQQLFQYQGCAGGAVSGAADLHQTRLD